MTLAASPVRLAVCADDFGLTPAINEAIVDLARAGRLSALSCLVDAPAFRNGAPHLAPIGSDCADVGLHLNFTESFGERAPRFGLPALIVRAWGRLLAPRTVRCEIRRQLDLFESGCGFAPHHVDGHQHIQQFPVIREALLEELDARYPGRRPWLRSGVPAANGSASGALKPAILSALGARTLVRQATQRGFATNAHLLGVYDFSGSAGEYEARLRQWLAQARDGDLLMTHPGAGERAGDPIATARRNEFAVLGGPAFAPALAASNVVVARLSQRR